MKTYVVQTPLDHDNVRYEIGQSVSLPDNVAAPLVAIGVLIAEPAEGESADGAEEGAKARTKKRKE